jgi:hypothetical protein
MAYKFTYVNALSASQELFSRHIQIEFPAMASEFRIKMTLVL